MFYCLLIYAYIFFIATFFTSNIFHRSGELSRYIVGVSFSHLTSYVETLQSSDFTEFHSITSHYVKTEWYRATTLLSFILSPIKLCRNFTNQQALQSFILSPHKLCWNFTNSILSTQNSKFSSPNYYYLSKAFPDFTLQFLQSISTQGLNNTR